MAIYSKDKRYHCNIRLNVYQYEFIERLKGDTKSISDVIRMIIDSYIWGCDFNANEQTSFDD